MHKQNEKVTDSTKTEPYLRAIKIKFTQLKQVFKVPFSHFHSGPESFAPLVSE